MNPRMYRLLEKHQRLDEALRQEQERRWPDTFKVIRLRQLKLRAKQLIHRFALRTARI